ncbi:unnamed protein product [Nippostrongylus brasiliensis]|uniref:Uncharacterized protein n=1 Tax=Nippostrongylus brasiliensis TaxID=27835 RepID=A0A0N4YEN5_NIPBR|nr:unnamed protein product [Nippostrongylus brasiliensis]
MQSGRSEANSEDGIWSDDADVTASFTLPPVATLSLKPSVSRSVIQDDDDDNDFCDEQSPPLNCRGIEWLARWSRPSAKGLPAEQQVFFVVFNMNDRFDFVKHTARQQAQASAVLTM